MFGINKKAYYILSGLALCGSAIVFILTILSVISDKQIGYLSALALFLIGISFFITPSSKKMKIVDSLIRDSRESFYKELETKDAPVTELSLFEKNQRLYFERLDGFCYEGLSYEDSLYLFKKLVKDYVVILYSVYENNKLNLKKAIIESFSLYIIKENGEKEEIKIVEKYVIL